MKRRGQGDENASNYEYFSSMNIKMTFQLTFFEGEKDVKEPHKKKQEGREGRKKKQS